MSRNRVLVPAAAVLACTVSFVSPALAADPPHPTGVLHGCIQGEVPQGLKIYAIPVLSEHPEAALLPLAGTCFRAMLPQTTYLVRAKTGEWRGQAPLIRLGDDARADIRLIRANGSDPQLAEKLHAMAKADQAVRRNLDYNDQAALRAMAKVDNEHEAILRGILQTHGWPSAELVGYEGVNDCWLLVQHGPFDLMEAHLPAMQAAAARGDLTPSSVALTVDRVLVHQGKKQIYGSQFKSTPSGGMEPDPIEDVERLDERRAQMGLGPFEEYRKLFAPKR
jgi:hypothetical protein